MPLTSKIVDAATIKALQARVGNLLMMIRNDTQAIEALQAENARLRGEVSRLLAARR